jgi:hypothetical protein
VARKIQNGKNALDLIKAQEMFQSVFFNRNMEIIPIITDEKHNIVNLGIKDGSMAVNE